MDALGLLSVKLDGGGGTYGTGLLPVHGAAIGIRRMTSAAWRSKAKLSETGACRRVDGGTADLRSDDGRSLPQTFQGGMITSRRSRA